MTADTSEDAAALGVLCVVVTYNSEVEIVNCLKSVSAQVSRVIVWDNASTDQTIAIVRRDLPQTEIISSPLNLGYGAAINAAVRACGHRGDVLALNPDCTVPNGTIASMAQLMRSVPTAGIVAPAMKLGSGRAGVPGGPFPTLVKEGLAATRLDEKIDGPWLHKLITVLSRLPISPRFIRQMSASKISSCQEIDWVSGFCMLIGSHTWRDVGGFDPDIFLYFEDVALCHAARSAGWASYCDGRVWADHDESRSTTIAGKSTLYYEGMWTYFRKYGSPAQKIAAAILGRRRIVRRSK